MAVANLHSAVYTASKVIKERIEFERERERYIHKEPMRGENVYILKPPALKKDKERERDKSSAENGGKEEDEENDTSNDFDIGPQTPGYLFPRPDFYDTVTVSGAIISPSLTAAPDSGRALTKLLPVSPIGLYNLGNTCFMNAVLQCLLHTLPLAKYLHACRHMDAPTKGRATKSSVFSALGAMGETLGKMKASRKALPPRHWVQNLRAVSTHFRHGRQEDAHEFCACLLDCMEKELLREVRGKIASELSRTTFVGQLFNGYLQSQVKCTQCQRESNTYDPIQHLSLEVTRKVSSMTSALKRFVCAEVLEGSNAYHCERCDVKVKAEKRLLVHQLPPVLVVHMKRFTLFGDKVTKFIEFPMQWTVAEDAFSSNSPHRDHSGRKPGSQPPFSAPQYQLYAVIVHDGWSLNAGHYYAYIRSAVNGLWYCVDDDDVMQVKESTVLKQKAYMLWYQRIHWDDDVEGRQMSSRREATGTGEDGRSSAQKEDDESTAATAAVTSSSSATSSPSQPQPSSADKQESESESVSSSESHSGRSEDADFDVRRRSARLRSQKTSKGGRLRRWSKSVANAFLLRAIWKRSASQRAVISLTRSAKKRKREAVEELLGRLKGDESDDASNNDAKDTISQPPTPTPAVSTPTTKVRVTDKVTVKAPRFSKGQGVDPSTLVQKPAAKTQFGTEVSGWDDEDSENTAVQREQQSKLLAEIPTYNRMRAVDAWDEELDRGRTKKMRRKMTSTVTSAIRSQFDAVEKEKSGRRR